MVQTCAAPAESIRCRWTANPCPAIRMTCFLSLVTRGQVHHYKRMGWARGSRQHFCPAPPAPDFAAFFPTTSVCISFLWVLTSPIEITFWRIYMSNNSGNGLIWILDGLGNGEGVGLVFGSRPGSGGRRGGLRPA